MTNSNKQPDNTQKAPTRTLSEQHAHHGTATESIIPDIVYILEKIREHAVETQDLAATIRFINGYIERLEKL